MVAGDWTCLRDRRDSDGEGDLGAGEDLDGASVGGSSLAVVGTGGC